MEYVDLEDCLTDALAEVPGCWLVDLMICLFSELSYFHAIFSDTFKLYELDIGVEVFCSWRRELGLEQSQDMITEELVRRIREVANIYEH